MKRQGSILATSLAMTAVFLTMVVGAAAYVHASTARSNNDRWRALAEQAARSGMDYVLGWAQANIDKESKLPADWSNMQDGQVINPVYAYAAGTSPLSGLDDVQIPQPGDILGKGTNNTAASPGAPDGVGELVISRQGDYYVSFKARVLQFRVSDDQPRQYRVGVLGRVRHLAKGGPHPSKALDPADLNAEYSDLVAERFIETYVGQESLARYAALIDFDGVRNWAPGEVTDGPVHINRGYVDSKIDTQGATAYRDLGQTIAGGSIDALDATKIRSMMNIRTTAGGFFSAIGAGPDHPVFNDTVSLTVVTKADNDKLAAPVYTNDDAADLSTALQLDGQKLDLSGGGSWSTKGTDIFTAPANKANKDFGGTLAGPLLLRHPVELPKSVRNRIGTAMGCSSLYAYSVLPGDPAGTASGWFANLPDGLYIPTKKFWASAASPVDANAYATSESTGGVYVRGNVEIMRSAVQGKYSFYFFQLGYGNSDATPNHREYVVIANRSTAEMWLLAEPSGAASAMTMPGLGSASASSIPDLSGLAATVQGQTGPGMITALGAHFTQSSDPAAFAQVGGGACWAYFPPNGTGYPFNGMVMVDISLNDPARVKTNPFIYAQQVPVTGNIFALGDPGANGSSQPAPYKPYLVANKRQLGSASADHEERFATYKGTDKTGPASRLDILAAGAIFIQNNLYVDALSQYGGFPDFAGGTAKTQLNVGTCKDVLGLVADKQIVLGLAAPSDTTRGNRGVVVHAAIAALGDPGFDFIHNKVFNNYKHDNYAYRGSLTTEGLMQYFNVPEDYYVCYGAPTGVPEYQVIGISPTDDYAPVDLNTTPCWTTQVYGTGPKALNGYPGSPIYQLCGMHANYTADFLANPNGTASRGRAVVLGSVIQKKRGIIGKGNHSYDKNFIYDRRLLTLAPALPSSANVITKTIAPSSPDRNDARLAYMYRH